MSTHTAISYRIVFSTKNRAPILKQERREDLFRWNGTCSKGPIVRPLRGRDDSFVDSFSVG
jgi:hypothetical protein